MYINQPVETSMTHTSSIEGGQDVICDGDMNAAIYNLGNSRESRTLFHSSFIKRQSHIMSKCSPTLTALYHENNNAYLAVL